MADEEKKAAEEPKAGPETPQPKGRRRKAKHERGKGKKDDRMATRIVATVFGAVIAPILVALGIKFLGSKVTDSPPPSKDKHVTAQSNADDDKERDKPKPKGNVIDLITPNLGDHFYTFAWNPEIERDERKDVIDPGMFRYDETHKRLVVPVRDRPALLISKAEFEDFSLHLWYRWGEKQAGLGEGKARRACILVHVTGPDGSVAGIWPQCLVVHLGEGDAGTIRLMGAPNRIQCKARVQESEDRLRREFVGGEAQETSHVTGEPPEWGCLMLRRGFPAGIDRDDKGFLLVVEKGWHPAGDLTWERPYKEGFWNRVLVECSKDTVSVSINRKLVNRLSGLNLKKGKIGLSSQWSEYEIQRLEVEVKPPEKVPEKPPEKARP